MPHANIIRNDCLDDDLQPIDGPEFDPPSWLPKTFKEAIEQLAPQRDYVPQGWRPVFDETLVKLHNVSCSNRHGIEFSEIAFGQGEMVIAAQGSQNDTDGHDRVVQGILNRLRQASAATCSCCGTRIGVAYRRESFATLCNRCHVHEHLEQTLDDILARKPSYTQAPLIEWDALPANIQSIVPQDQVKTLNLTALGGTIRYVEPQALLALKPQLQVLKQALVQARGG